MEEITYKNFSEKISKNPKDVFLVFYSNENPQEKDYLNQLESWVYAYKPFYQTDIQNEGAIFASLYGILSTPTLLLLHAGKETARYSGFLSKEQFLEILKS